MPNADQLDYSNYKGTGKLLAAGILRQYNTWTTLIMGVSKRK